MSTPPAELSCLGGAALQDSGGNEQQPEDRPERHVEVEDFVHAPDGDSSERHVDDEPDGDVRENSKNDDHGATVSPCALKEKPCGNNQPGSVSPGEAVRGNVDDDGTAPPDGGGKCKSLQDKPHEDKPRKSSGFLLGSLLRLGQVRTA